MEEDDEKPHSAGWVYTWSSRDRLFTDEESLKTTNRKDELTRTVNVELIRPRTSVSCRLRPRNEGKASEMTENYQVELRNIRCVSTQKQWE